MTAKEKYINGINALLQQFNDEKTFYFIKGFLERQLNSELSTAPAYIPEPHEVKFDNSALRERILQNYGTIKAFAAAAGMSAAAVSNRLNNKTEFTMQNIADFAKLLEIVPDRIDHYFFTPAF